MSRRRLIVTAPRGSGGSYAHLPRVLPRLMKLEPTWDIELYASSEVLQACFGKELQPWMRALPGSGYGHRLRWEFVDLPRLLDDDRRAVVWAPFGPPLNLRLAPRTVWMSRNIIPLLPMRDWEVGPSDRLRLGIVRALIARWAIAGRRSICVSEHARARLATLAGIDPGSIDVVPHGVDRPPPDQRCRVPDLERLRQSAYVFCAGQPTPYRRTLELAGAYAHLAARHPDVPPLVLAGKARPRDSAYEGKCVEVLEQLAKVGRAHFLGQVGHDDALALIGSAQTFVYPSVHEDCPNVVLEALAAGRIGVYADIPAVRELVGNAGLLVPDPRPSTLADAMHRAITDEGLRGTIPAAAVDRAARFTWDETAAKTAAVLSTAFQD